MSTDQNAPLLRQGRLLRPFANAGLSQRENRGTSDTNSRVERSRHTLRQLLTSRAGHYAVLLLVSLDVTCIFADFIVTIFTCKSKRTPEDTEEALEALEIVSLVFSCLFMVELLASIWAFGFEYFKSTFHLFDAFVITASFIIDILLRGPLEEVASLIIILRLWRVVKIIEELSVGAQEQMEGLQEKVEVLEQENAQLREEVKGLRVRVDDDNGRGN